MYYLNFFFFFNSIYIWYILQKLKKQENYLYHFVKITLNWFFFNALESLICGLQDFFFQNWLLKFYFWELMLFHWIYHFSAEILKNSVQYGKNFCFVLEQAFVQLRRIKHCKLFFSFLSAKHMWRMEKKQRKI